MKVRRHLWNTTSSRSAINEERKVFSMQAQNFMRVEEVAQELGISKSHAYKVIHKSTPNSVRRAI